MQIFLLIMQLLPMVLSVVKGVEETVDGAKKGSVKKETALGLLNSGLDIATKVGGVRTHDADAVRPHLSELVDGTVGILNSTGVFKRDTDTQS